MRWKIKWKRNSWQEAKRDSGSKELLTFIATSEPKDECKEGERRANSHMLDYTRKTELV